MSRVALKTAWVAYSHHSKPFSSSFFRQKRNRLENKRSAPASTDEILFARSGRSFFIHDRLLKGRTLTGLDLINARDLGFAEIEMPENVVHPQSLRESPPRQSSDPVSRHGVIFDVDKTLIDFNETGSDFYHWLFDIGQLTKFKVLWKMNWNLLRSQNFLVRNAGGARVLSGWSENYVRRLVKDFFDIYVFSPEMQTPRPLLYPLALELIKKYQSLCHAIVLASGSNYWLIEYLAKHLGCDFAVGNRTKTKDGILTKEMWGPVTAYTGKRDHLRELALRLKIPPENWSFLSDDPIDQPTFEYFGRPGTRFYTNYPWEQEEFVRQSGYRILRTDGLSQPLSPAEEKELQEYRQRVRQEKARDYEPPKFVSPKRRFIL